MDKVKKGAAEGQEKTPEEIAAQRKAKKAEKAAKKNQAKAAPAEKKKEAVAPAVAPESNEKVNVQTPTAVPPVTVTAPKAAPPKPEKEVAQPKLEKDGKSKAELRAERRAKQEAERAAKANAEKSENKQSAAPKQTQPKRVPDEMQADRVSVEKRTVKRFASQKVPQLPPAERKVQLFSHLEQKERQLDLLTKNMPINQGNIHPALIKLGLQYASGVVSGSNARAVAFLFALKKVIADYKTPPQKELSRDLDASLKPGINFLKQCRPLSASMGNVIRYMKRQITNVPSQISDEKAKEHLYNCIDNYVQENIELAGKAICEEAGKKISSGDVILTYGFSSLLLRVFLKAHVEDRKDFRVVVLDGGPRYEGRQMLRRLASANVRATYMLISGASYIMPEVTKVLLGAHALLSNGNVMSRVGASQVALVAKSHNVPVLVCCETYKFCERVQTDSFVFNELGDPDDLVTATTGTSSAVASWRDLPKLTLLNLTYDVMPADLVTAVITELAVLPCTSVPVVVRVKHAEAAA